MSKFINQINPKNVIVRTNPRGYGEEIVYADKPAEKVIVTMPPLAVSFPMLSGEGNLGTEFPSSDGKKIRVIDRPKAEFKLNLTMGDLDSEQLRTLLPTLKQDQREAFIVLYEIGKNVLYSLYDSRIENYMVKISEIEADCISNEFDIMKAQKEPGIKEIKDVKERMKTDSELRERINEKGRAKFFEKAKFKFPSPEEYDEDGNKRREDGSNLRLSFGMKRKVGWRRCAPPNPLAHGPTAREFVVFYSRLTLIYFR